MEAGAGTRCDSGLEWCTVDDGWRGFGGGGAVLPVEDVVESPEELRSAAGFLGGGGADLILTVEGTDGGGSFLPVRVSVLTRRSTGCGSGFSSGERSMRFCADSRAGGVGCDLRGGSSGRMPGWSSLILGNMVVERLLWSSSASRIEATIAALSSGSSSSDEA